MMAKGANWPTSSRPAAYSQRCQRRQTNEDTSWKGPVEVPVQISETVGNNARSMVSDNFVNKACVVKGGGDILW